MTGTASPPPPAVSPVSIADRSDLPSPVTRPDTTSWIQKRLGQAAAWQVGLFSLAVVVGLISQITYVSGVQSELRWQVFGVLTASATASVTVGGVLGFLFGIPRFTRVEQAAGSRRGSMYDQSAANQVSTLTPNSILPNTNLEQISDWLTKVLVGATLTQIGNIPGAANTLFSGMADAMGIGPSGTVFVGSTVIFAGALGFMFGWLATRTWVGRMLTAADDSHRDH